MFKAVLVEKNAVGSSAALVKLRDDELPHGDVIVRVAYSTLNYKDALAITGRSPVVRSFPMVPGIDLAGIVEQSKDLRFSPGDKVVLNGWGVGEHHWGGLAEKACLMGDWLIPLQAPFTMAQAMGIGTAGYTAMLCVMALEEHGIKPGKGELLVTGASGGVGSIAVGILSTLGYHVVAATGRPDEAAYLKHLGAAEIIDRAELVQPGKPLGKERWCGAVDVVGGQLLANICATLKYGGAVAACGLAGGMSLPSTVAPFILRGITLAGIDSVMCPRERRIKAWQRLSQDLDLGKLSEVMHEMTLDNVISASKDLLDGKIRGRLVVRVGDQ